MIDGVETRTPIAARPRLRAYDELPPRPWCLAPPLRIVSDPRAQVLTMYTIQTRDAYETLAHEAMLVGDPSLGWPELQEAYAWVLRQTNRRLPGPQGGLLWLWPITKPELLRTNARRASGHVLLTVRVASECARCSASSRTGTTC